MKDEQGASYRLQGQHLSVSDTKSRDGQIMFFSSVSYGQFEAKLPLFLFSLIQGITLDVPLTLQILKNT